MNSIRWPPWPVARDHEVINRAVRALLEPNARRRNVIAKTGDRTAEQQFSQQGTPVSVLQDHAAATGRVRAGIPARTGFLILNGLRKLPLVLKGPTMPCAATPRSP